MIKEKKGKKKEIQKAIRSKIETVFIAVFEHFTSFFLFL